ncbi:hypothetical protein CVU75_02070 [Candidatus Dependentiae bacterium HGW-Dependentiae-1]|nr:MAG: hypothetical protein CVU75_02070 [Candidatus Dependentiae bacterium HGW-Dependentiae-1]
MNLSQKNNLFSIVTRLLLLITSGVLWNCQAIVIVNDTKNSKYVELYTQVDDHLWMQQHNTAQNAPKRKIPIMRANLKTHDIEKTHPFLLNNLTINVLWGKKNKNSYEQHFNLSQSQALEGDPVPSHFTDSHIIRLVDEPLGSKNPIKAELLYLPHGKYYLKHVLSKLRALQKTPVKQLN